MGFKPTTTGATSKSPGQSSWDNVSRCNTHGSRTALTIAKIAKLSAFIPLATLMIDMVWPPLYAVFLNIPIPNCLPCRLLTSSRYYTDEYPVYSAATPAKKLAMSQRFT